MNLMLFVLLKNKTDVTYFSLHDRVNNVYTKVRAFMSQLPPNEVPKTLRCKVISVDQATNVLKLHQFFEDDYDSVYQDGEFYEFTYVEQDSEDNALIKAKGIDGKIYTLIQPFGSLKRKFEKNDVIKYVCQKGKDCLRFRPFVTFNDIIKYRILKQNTFDALKNSDSEYALKLYKDFNAKNNLWVLSFCKLLQEQYKISIEKDEYEKALMYGEVLVEIEFWIINSGFLQSFKQKIKEKEQ